MSGTPRGLWRARAVPLLITLLLLASSLHGWAQAFPGEGDPIANPSRLNQFPDDELAIFSFAPVAPKLFLSGSRSSLQTLTTPCRPGQTSLPPTPGPRLSAKRTSSATPA